MDSQYDRILTSLDKISGSKITVFGDYCLDKYLYIDPVRDEISLETNLTAYQIHKKRISPGVGGTVTNNLCALGARVDCIGIVGNDGEGHELVNTLGDIGANTSRMVKTDLQYTNTYIKPMRKGSDEVYSELNRMDIRRFTPTEPELERTLIKMLEKSIASSTQGVIITDQFMDESCSAITPAIKKSLSDMAAKYNNIFFYVDSRGFANKYQNMIVKCNDKELLSLFGKSINDVIDESIILEYSSKLAFYTKGPIIITRGNKGSAIFEKSKLRLIPSFISKKPIDIVGAGDASNAGIMLGLTLGLSLYDSAILGNCISSITIEKIGTTGTATIDEVKARLKQLK